MGRPRTRWRAQVRKDIQNRRKRVATYKNMYEMVEKNDPV